MRSDRFHSMLIARRPFVSAYFDDSHDTADAVAQLNSRWRDIRKHLEDAAVDPVVVSRLEAAVLHHHPVVGRRGRGIIATRDQTLVNEELTSPPPSTVLRISDYPYILPLVELGGWQPTYIVAAVDHAGADVSLHHGGVVRTHTVDGGGYPVHKSPAAENDYAHPQLRTEEAIRKNVRAVADDLTELVHQTNPEVVFVSGEVRSRTDVVSALPQHVRESVHQLTAGSYRRHIDDDAISGLIEAELSRRRHTEIADATDRFNAENGRQSGLAVQGMAAVCAALHAGNIETLLVGELANATVVTGEDRAGVAPNADVLSEWGHAATLVARADEALPFAAIAVGASLMRIDNTITPTDGIAALLRYPSAG